MSQRTLWEWKQQRGEFSEGGGRKQTRGSLDLSELPEETAAGPSSAHQLHWQLECHLGTVDLVITDNRRRMLTTKTKRGRRRIRLHHMFLGCGPETVTAIVQLADGDDRAREHIKEYIDQNRQEIRFQPEETELDRRGEHFHLEEVLEDVRELVDEAGVDDIEITWGRDGRGSKSIRFGSFDFDQRLIRVHPALDEAWVPRYFVEFIVYHELLHAICPPEEECESRRVHTSRFLELEREFPRYEEAVEWESENLRRILDRRPDD